MSKEYLVDFSIEVSANSAVDACKTAWAYLANGDMRPVGTVFNTETGDREDVDLEEMDEV